MLGSLSQKDLFYISDLLKSRNTDLKVLMVRASKDLKRHYNRELKDNIRILEAINRNMQANI